MTPVPHWRRSGSAKPQYVYHVTERLVGEAYYDIVAGSKAEALQKLRDGDHGNMHDSKINHTGSAQMVRGERVIDSGPSEGDRA